MAVKSVTLSEAPEELEVGDSITLTATVLPEDASSKTVVWSTSDKTIATVTKSGVVTAVGKGEVTITARSVSSSDIYASVTLTCKISVTGIELDQSKLEMDIKDTITLNATVSPEDASDKDVTWTSSNESVATVNDGLVTAVSVGKAVITAKTTDGLSAECEVTVKDSIADVADLINAIGEVTTESGDAIEAARQAYDALTDEQKEAVSNYQTLLDAENEYLVLISGENAQAAQAAAEAAREAAKRAQAAAASAQQAAEDAAEAVADDQSAAEAAARAAETAQQKAEDAQKLAQDAQAAADEAAEAAKNADVNTTKEAATAARAAAAAAEDTADAAASAAVAAEVCRKAQETQAAAEAAQKAAEEAAAAAEAEREAAEKAKEEAEAAEEAAKEAAEAAKKEAEEALATAEAERQAAEQAKKEAEAAQAAAAAEAALSIAKYQALSNLNDYATELTLNADTEQILNVLAVVKEYRALIDGAAGMEEIERYAEEAMAAMENAVVCPSEKYTDVEKNTWYHASVDYMIENGYMKGVSGTQFNVNGSVTRAQLVTILYRIEGEPSVEGLENPFGDVTAGTWYTDAVIWAANEGVVKGVSETAFAPANEITREQIVTILYRYDGENKVEENALADYSDAATVSAYAADAMNWAIANGIVNGVTETTLAPQANAIRAQICAILMRYLEN